MPFETWQTSAFVLEDPATGSAGFFVTFERIVEAIEGLVEFHAPVDLDVITAPTDIIATIDSEQLTNWTLSHRPVGEATSTVIATGTGPVQNATLGQFDPTLLLNGLHEIVLTGSDAAGQQIVGKIAVSVEGNMKIGHFTLSFVDLAIPLSGLDIEIVRTYDSRQRLLQGDFGQGWTLEIRQGSYRNNRPPGDGWQFQTGFLPCDSILETKSHVTTVRLSDQEVYRFRLKLENGAPTQGGCLAEAGFEFVDGPLPGSTLKIVGNASVFYENGGDRVINADTLDVFVPEDVLLTTRDGRIFEFDLEDSVTRLEDLNGNELLISLDGITHANGVGVDFERDAEGRILRIVDPLDQALIYEYDGFGDLVAATDRSGSTVRFNYLEDHLLDEIIDPLGTRAVRSEYDADGRLLRMTDADGKILELEHDLDARREVVRNRLGFVQVLEYDGRGNVVRETDELGKVTTRTYDTKDRLLSETDPLGNTTTNDFNANGDLVSVTDPLGNVTRFAYGEFGSPISITDPRGKVTRFGHDSMGNVSSTTDPRGSVTTFTYDQRGQLLSETDPLGHVTSYSYDQVGNQISVVDALGTETTWTYDSNGNATSQTTQRTLPDGTAQSLTTTFTLDELGRVTSTTLPDGSTSSTIYDGLGAVLSTTDALGRVTSFTYDGLGQQITTTHPDGTTERREFDAEGRVIAVTDRAERLTTFIYDPVGRLLATTFPDGATTSSSYDDAGRLVTSTDEGGFTTSYAYDAAGRRAQVVDAVGHATTFSYDAAGNQISVTDALGHVTRFEHDDTGLQVRTILPDGTIMAYEYDAVGRRVAEIDQANRRTGFVYDPLGRLVAVQDALSGVTRYAYDEQGNRISQTDANGNTTRFTFDEVGRQIGRILPGGERESTVYDAVGNRVRRTDFNGATTNYTYDVNNRLVRRTYPDWTSVSFTHTVTGRRESVTDARGVTEYAYDETDQLLSMTASEGWTLRYTWDEVGNRTSMTADLGDQGLHTTTYTRDALGRIAAITDARGGVYVYGYDAVGRHASLTYPNGVSTTWQHDSVGRMIQLRTEAADETVIQDYVYDFGPAGNRLSVTEQDGTVRAWDHDELYRLTREQVTAADGARVYENTFVYDPVGNRTEQVRTGSDGTSVTISYAYDDRDRLLSETVGEEGTTFFEWDANGNLIRRAGSLGETRYGWDFENRMVSVQSPDGGVVGNAYDADGIRLTSSLKASLMDPAIETRYVTDTSGFLSHVVAEVTGSGALNVHYALGDTRLALLRASGETYAHADHLGSIRALTESTSAVADTYAYEAFGELFDHLGNDPNPFLFAGQQRDSSTGLDYLRARWLDFSVGRFISMDPAPELFRPIVEQSHFLYSRADPINRFDPSGLTSIPDVSAALSQLGTLSNMTFRVFSILEKLQTVVEMLTLIQRFLGLVTSGQLSGVLTNSLDALKNPQRFDQSLDFEISDVLRVLRRNQGRIANAAFKKWFRWSQRNWNKIKGYGLNIPTPIGMPVNGRIELPGNFNLAGKPFFLILGGRNGGTITGLSVVARLPGSDVANIWRMDYHNWTPGHPIGGNKHEIDAWPDEDFHFHVRKPPGR